MFDVLAPRLIAYRFALVLCALLALILIAPLLGNDPKGEANVAILFSLILIGLGITSVRPWLASAVSVIWIGLVWLVPFDDHIASEIAIDLMLMMVCLLAIEGALWKALRRADVGSEELCAAVSAYLLIGISFAAIYAALQSLDPAAFALDALDAERSWSALLYFSFATLTTLGYGDVTPVSSLARAWASVEAVIGTIFLAILIAHLVGNFSRRALN